MRLEMNGGIIYSLQWVSKNLKYDDLFPLSISFQLESFMAANFLNRLMVLGTSRDEIKSVCIFTVRKKRFKNKKDEHGRHIVQPINDVSGLGSRILWQQFPSLIYKKYDEGGRRIKHILKSFMSNKRFKKN